MQVHSDSDIQLDWTSGSFKRFDSIDRDFKISIATTSLNDWKDYPESPRQEETQPKNRIIGWVLHVSTYFPTKTILYVNRDGFTIESTSISPIPRPVSSINMAALQSQFPVSLDPPPSSRNVSRTQSAPLKLSALQQQSQGGVYSTVN